MSGRDFIDTNVLVYAYDSGDPRKQRIAQELVRQALAGSLVLSVQVLAEFAATLLRKSPSPTRARDVAAILESLSPIEAISPGAETVRKAAEAHAAYGIHFYDAMIVAAAHCAGCSRIWSEDLNAGQRYFEIAVENPF